MRGDLWVLSYIVLWIAVVLLALTVVALVRQIGVLHTRIAPMGAHFGGEGPTPGSFAPGAERFDYGSARLTLLAFTAATCEVCRRLRPSLGALARQYHDVTLTEVDLGQDPGVFRVFDVRSTPYFVAVDRLGVVRGAGVANTLEQIEELVTQATASQDAT
jgi:hypothetical protein